MGLGATYLGGSRCHFVVWAPRANTVELQILEHPQWSVQDGGAVSRSIALDPAEGGYHQRILGGIEPGLHYVYRLNGSIARPDPASRFQPAGVHGPSQVRDPGGFKWSDGDWTGLELQDYILYELHTGAYTAEGTFDALIPHLGAIRDIGVRAVELMPVAQFPGDHNWGYDGVYPFAVQNSYGGPRALQRFVDACHTRGLAAVLDVVYNHLVPEGNYFADFGPYFTDQYRTPWGAAFNFDGAESDHVVRFFTENALYWLNEFHFDALRLDAIHGIVDRSAQPFLQQLALAIHEFAAQAGRKIYLFAESDFNDTRYIRPAACGGYGLDAQWNDDFHHSLHTLLTGERSGYYQDFGDLGQMQKAFREGFVYSGQYSAFRRRRHGNSSCAIPARQLVVFAQNHDQTGNRMQGERLSTLIGFEALKLAAAAVLLSPFIPMLFMGEEYAELAPFQYFTSHADRELIEAVRRGRREEFADSQWQGEPPDAQNAETFWRSKLDHRLRHQEPHRTFLSFVRELLAIRRTMPCFASPSKKRQEVFGLEERKVIAARRWNGGSEGLLLFNFSHSTAACQPLPGCWRLLADSADIRWGGPGSSVARELSASGGPEIVLAPQSACIFQRSHGGT